MRRVNRLGGALGIGLGLFKNTHNLRLKLRKFHGKHVAARMEDEIHSHGQQVGVAAQGLAHAALDAIALVGFAHHFAHSEPDARRRRNLGAGYRLWREEPTHRSRLPFTARGVGAHKIGVLTQPCTSQCLASSRIRWRLHEEARGGTAS